MSIACYLLVIQSALCCTCVFFDCNKSHISGMCWCYRTGFSTRVPQTGCLPTLFVFVTKVDVWVLLNRVQLQTFVRCTCVCVSQKMTFLQFHDSEWGKYCWHSLRWALTAVSFVAVALLWEVVVLALLVYKHGFFLCNSLHAALLHTITAAAAAYSMNQWQHE